MEKKTKDHKPEAIRIVVQSIVQNALTVKENNVDPRIYYEILTYFNSINSPALAIWSILYVENKAFIFAIASMLFNGMCGWSKSDLIEKKKS